MTKAFIPSEKKVKWQHKDATKTFDYTTYNYRSVTTAIQLVMVKPI